MWKECPDAHRAGGEEELSAMREFTVTSDIDRPELRSASGVLAERMLLDPEHIAFARQIDDDLVEVSISQFRDDVRSLASGLLALNVEPGDRVAIMSPTRYEWAVAEFAIWEAGAVVVPVYETASVAQAESILDECAVRVAFAGTPAHRDVLNDARSGLSVWTFDDDLGRDLAELARQGASAGIAESELDRRSRLAGPEDVASIVFTSGTTGRQKGVLITHGNLVRLVVQVAAAYEEVVNDRASTIILLPLAHILAQGLQLVSVYAGMRIVHVGDPRQAVAAMAAVRPTFMVVVPRILERIRAAVRAKAQERRLGRVFAKAERIAVSWGEHLESIQDGAALTPSRSLSIWRRIFDRLFYSRLRELMGGRVEYLLSGASPLDGDLGNFFRGVGIPVIEGYGLTETTAPVTGNRPGRMRAGSVGIPIPGSSVRISDDGEILVSGVGVTPGYLRSEDNDDAFVDGYYRTGDIGSLDDDGFLYIRGRLKNIIVTANGKNIAPEPWERVVATDPLVGEAIMVGDGMPYAAALIVLDTAEAISWARHRGADDLAEALERAAHSPGVAGVPVDDDRIRAHLSRTIDRANAAVSRAEQVRRFLVLITELSEEGLTLTPTLKLRRTVFLEAMAHHINDLYQEKV